MLARYVAAADLVESRYVVRATADNPAVDIGTTSRVLAAVEHAGAEYGVEEDLPYGSAVEVIASDTLRRLAGIATDPSDREHVTLFIKRHMPAFLCVTPPAPIEVRRPDLRLTVDTAADAGFMRTVLGRVDRGPEPAPLTEIIAEADWLQMRGAA